MNVARASEVTDHMSLLVEQLGRNLESGEDKKAAFDDVRQMLRVLKDLDMDLRREEDAALGDAC